MLIRTPILAVVPWALASEPVLAATLGTAAGPGVPWLRIVVAFAFCIGLAIAAIWLLRMYRERRIAQSATGWLAKRKERDQRKIEVVETRRISAHADVCLLRWQGRSYLLLVGQSGASLIDSDGQDRQEQAR